MNLKKKYSFWEVSSRKKLLKTRSITPAQTYLEEMASEGKKLLVHIYNERVALSDRLLPFMAARNSQGEPTKKKRKNKAKALSPDRNQPGSESRNGFLKMLIN